MEVENAFNNKPQALKQKGGSACVQILDMWRKISGLFIKCSPVGNLQLPFNRVYLPMCIPMNSTNGHRQPSTATTFHIPQALTLQLPAVRKKRSNKKRKMGFTQLLSGDLILFQVYPCLLVSDKIVQNTYLCFPSIYICKENKSTGCNNHVTISN